LKKETELMVADVLEKAAKVEDTVRGASRIRSIVTDAVEDGVRSANQAVRHGRYAAEDTLEEVKHTVKQRPFEAVGVAFAAGVLAGGLLTWIGLRKR
jgi:ElaB/YqjD/DUF883 family membrane-anchored ribosome-binding protein